MIFGTRQNIKSKSKAYSCVIACFDGMPLQRVEHTKYLGLWLESELSFKCHVSYIEKKMNVSIGVLYCYRNCFSFPLKRSLHYNSFYQYWIMLMLYIRLHLKVISVLSI